MKSFLRPALPAAFLAVATFAWSTAGSAQAQPQTTLAAAQPEGWLFSFSPRVGYFLPQHTGAGDRGAVRRPTFGMELLVRRKGSWYGARALFERSTRWNPQQGVTGGILSNGPFSASDSPESQFFETVVADLMAYTPAYRGVRAYAFSGYGSKVIGAPEGPAILPYSLVAAERAPALHGGMGIEAPVGGGAVVFEVGDYYGRNGGEARVHDIHITMMARLSGIGDFVRALVAGEESDG